MPNLTVGHIQDLPGDGGVSERASGVHTRLLPAREEIADLVAEKVIAVLRKLPAAQPRLLSIRDAATYLACSKRSVETMVAACEIPTVRRGGHPRIDIRDLDAWIEKHKTEAA
jgi:excisionase family DNA binding protein